MMIRASINSLFRLPYSLDSFIMNKSLTAHYDLGLTDRHWFSIRCSLQNPYISLMFSTTNHQTNVYIIINLLVLSTSINPQSLSNEPAWLSWSANQLCYDPRQADLDVPGGTLPCPAAARSPEADPLGSLFVSAEGGAVATAESLVVGSQPFVRADVYP